MTHDSSTGLVSDGAPAWPPADGFVPAHRRRPRWGLPSALIGLVMFLGVQLVVGVAFVLVFAVTGGDIDAAPTLTLGLVSLLPAYVAVLLWQYLVARRKGAGIVVEYGLRFRWYDLFTGVAGGFAAMGLVLVGTLAMSKLTGVEPSSSVGTTVLESTQSGPVLFVFLLVIAFLGPFVEEIHFRGMWWKAFRNRFGPVLTLLFTSALFGLIHLEPVRMVGLLLGGMVFGALRLLFDRVGPALVAHVLVNSVAAGSLFYELVLK